MKMMMSRRGVVAMLTVALAVMLAVVLTPQPVAAGSKIPKIGKYFWKQYVARKTKEVRKKQKVERAKQYQEIRQNRDDWQLDCCELLKERIRSKKLTIEDMVKIRDFVDWRLPKTFFERKKKPYYKNITEEVGRKIISDELTSFDYELIYEKIKDPNYKPHWALSIWIALGDYGRECILRPTPVPGPLGVGM